MWVALVDWPAAETCDFTASDSRHQGSQDGRAANVSAPIERTATAAPPFLEALVCHPPTQPVLVQSHSNLRARGMGARMVAFLGLLSGLDCLDCLAEKGKPESKRHKLETPQLLSSRRRRMAVSTIGTPLRKSSVPDPDNASALLGCAASSLAPNTPLQRQPCRCCRDGPGC